MAIDLGSFRDPAGYIYYEQGSPKRKITSLGLASWKQLKNSGLLEALQSENLLIKHSNIAEDCIAPEKIPFISYPQEWSFSQLKDAALLTLKIVEKSISYGYILKDASAYNVQFLNGRPIFIDTLSFETYKEGSPWIAYKQFCQHFLAPLALMSKTDIGLLKLSATYIDGVPLPLVSKLLPFSTKFSLQLYLHIHLHAKSQEKFADVTDIESKTKKRSLSKTALLGLLDGLKSCINSLRWRPQGTEWGDYYNGTNYTNESMSEKGRLVGEYVALTNPKSIWDLGANTGVFSHIALEKSNAEIVSFDIDPAAVEKHYLYLKSLDKKSILPLVLDLTNPTPSYGWAGKERTSVEARGPADLIMALALIHHIAISNNVPLEKIAEYFSKLGKQLIIEFVPKSDSQVIKLLSTREDIFPHYTKQGFETAFSKFFTFVKSIDIKGSERTLYLMTAKN